MINIAQLALRTQSQFSRPLVGLKWAQTLDGQLADDEGKSKWISGAEELNYTHELRAQFDGVLVGASTFLADFSKLTVRSRPVLKQPIRVIFDPRNRVLTEFKLRNALVIEALSDPARPTLILNTLESRSVELIAGLVYSVGLVRGELSAESLRAIADFSLEVLNRDFNSVMVEGGPTTLKLFLNRNLVDVACVGIAPILTGGLTNRIQLMQGLDQAYRMQHHSTRSHGQDTVIEMVHRSLVS